MKATDQIQRYDRRRARAVALTAALMLELDDVLGEYDKRAVYERLLKVLYDNGAAWTTDEERAALGLEPRDELGWTPSERVANEQHRIEAMQLMAAGIVIPPASVADVLKAGWPKLPTES